MTEPKTQRNAASVTDFIDRIEDTTRQSDCREILEIMREVTGAEPEMWGSSIVGFDTYRYQYANGRTADWMLTGFAPRKQNLVIYIMAGFARYEELLSRLGRHKTGQSCLYIKKLADIDRAVLRELVTQSAAHFRASNQVAE